MNYFLAFSDELFTKLFILIHSLFMWGKIRNLSWVVEKIINGRS